MKVAIGIAIWIVACILIIVFVGISTFSGPSIQELKHQQFMLESEMNRKKREKERVRARERARRKGQGR